MSKKHAKTSKTSKHLKRSKSYILDQALSVVAAPPGARRAAAAALAYHPLAQG